MPNCNSNQRTLLVFDGEAKVVDRTVIIDVPHLDAAKYWTRDFDILLSFAQRYPHAVWLTITIGGQTYLPKFRIKHQPKLCLTLIDSSNPTS